MVLPEDLAIEVQERSGAVSIQLAGEIDFGNVARLRSALLDASRNGIDVEVDMGSVEFIDSTALGVIVQAKKRLAEDGHRMVFTGINPRVRRVFELTGLTDILDGARHD